MRVLITSTSFPASNDDWRGIFIRNMVDAIAQQQDVNVRLWAPPGNHNERVRPVTTVKEAEWLHQLMLSGGISHLMRHGKMSGWIAPVKLLRYLRRAYLQNSDVDIYHINWLQCALALPANDRPVLLTVLGNDFKLLKFPFVRALLRRVMQHRAVTICPNAEWMGERLHDYFGKVASVVPVAFGLEDSWYRIKRDANLEAPIWIVVSRLTREKLGPLFVWGEEAFAGGKRELHLFGPMQENIHVPNWVRYHGPTTPAALNSDWFPRVAGLITLSRHAEGRPQVMMEAMAAGVPIIASRTQAHASLVADGESGLLCETQAEFASDLTTIEDASINAKFGSIAKLRCQKDFGTWNDCGHRYTKLYRDLLSV